LSRALKGDSAVMTRTPAGVIEQTLVQMENPAQATKQDLESVKVRSYTVAGVISSAVLTSRRHVEVAQASRPTEPATSPVSAPGLPKV
jgi:hypothetical protein